MKLNQLLAILCLYFTSALVAQPRCGFDELHQKKLKESPKYKKNVSSNEKSILNYIEKNKHRLYSKVTSSNTALFKIPVVVHVIHTGGTIGSIYNPTDAQIEGAINYLNQVYNGSYPGTGGAGDIQIQFVLPERDPNCNTTTGINRINGSAIPNYTSAGVNAETILGADELTIKNLIRWAPSEYYNIWIVNKIDGNDGTSGSFIAGFAYFPGIAPVLDGTIMLATQMQTGRKTLPHEIGHAFGLYHPFQGSNSTTCSSPGDYVNDTDPITLPVGFTCRTGINNCTGTNYNENTESNYMNYTNCFTLFTLGQKARMQAAAASIFRKSLSTSSALVGTNLVNAYGAPKNTSCIPTTSSTGLNGTYAGLINIDINNINRYSSSADIDRGYVNATSECIKLIPLVQGSNYTFTASVYAANYEQLRAWIDFNDDGTFSNDTEEEIIFETEIPENATDFETVSVSFTVPATATINKVLRMRVIDDLAVGYPGTTPISSACHNPVYGQAEDYAIYISPKSLPITLIDFVGRFKNNNIQLNWKTSAESNFSHFEIEKSTDGTSFSKIGIAKSVGSSTHLQVYSFSDFRIQSTNFYRLKLVDIDGRHTYSKTILIKPDHQINQNVWISSTFLEQEIGINLSKTARLVTLELMNQNGVLVDKLALRNTSTFIQWKLNNKLIINGIYYLKARTEDKTYTFKLIKN